MLPLNHRNIKSGKIYSWNDCHEPYDFADDLSEYVSKGIYLGGEMANYYGMTFKELEIESYAKITIHELECLQNDDVIEPGKEICFDANAYGGEALCELFVGRKYMVFSDTHAQIYYGHEGGNLSELAFYQAMIRRGVEYAMRIGKIEPI